MVAEGYRARVAPYIARISRPFLSWDPNRISLLALLLAGLAAVLAAAVRWTTPYLFLPVAVLIFLSGTFDVIDGEVARKTGKASARGDFLDHVFDRYADVMLLVGIGISGYVSPILALLALVSLLLTSYMGTQAQAVGVGREYGGLLSRADRLLALAGVTFLEFLFVVPWPWAPGAPWARFTVGAYSFTVLDLLMVYFIVAGQLTAIARARSIYARIPA
jgi:archaetidylinositol phosphate synthase